MKPRSRRAVAGAGALILTLTLGTTAATAAGKPHRSEASTSPERGRDLEHVLLISVDGMHQSDLNWYVRHHPGSALARLASAGAQYTNVASSPNAPGSS
jgi:hypothetical protein